MSIVGLASAALAAARPRALAEAGYAPFLQPLPIWDYWIVLLLPLCVAVAVVYKSIKCRWMRQVPREATVLAVWILAGLSGAAAVLAILVRLVERAQS